MNLFTKTLIAAGTASIALSPIAAAAAPAAPIAPRAAPSVAGDSEFRGRDNDAPGLIIALAVLAALAVAFVLIEDDENDNLPISP